MSYTVQGRVRKKYLEMKVTSSWKTIIELYSPESDNYEIESTVILVADLKRSIIPSIISIEGTAADFLRFVDESDLVEFQLYGMPEIQILNEKGSETTTASGTPQLGIVYVVDQMIEKFKVTKFGYEHAPVEVDHLTLTKRLRGGSSKYFEALDFPNFVLSSLRHEMLKECVGNFPTYQLQQELKTLNRLLPLDKHHTVGVVWDIVLREAFCNICIVDEAQLDIRPKEEREMAVVTFCLPLENAKDLPWILKGSVLLLEGLMCQLNRGRFYDLKTNAKDRGDQKCTFWQMGFKKEPIKFENNIKLEFSEVAAKSTISVPPLGWRLRIIEEYQWTQKQLQNTDNEILTYRTTLHALQQQSNLQLQLPLESKKHGDLTLKICEVGYGKALQLKRRDRNPKEMITIKETEGPENYFRVVLTDYSDNNKYCLLSTLSFVTCPENPSFTKLFQAWFCNDSSDFHNLRVGCFLTLKNVCLVENYYLEDEEEYHLLMTGQKGLKFCPLPEFAFETKSVINNMKIYNAANLRGIISKTKAEISKTLKIKAWLHTELDPPFHAPIPDDQGEKKLAWMSHHFTFDNPGDFAEDTAAGKVPGIMDSRRSPMKLFHNINEIKSSDKSEFSGIIRDLRLKNLIPLRSALGLHDWERCLLSDSEAPLPFQLQSLVHCRCDICDLDSFLDEVLESLGCLEKEDSKEDGEISSTPRGDNGSEFSENLSENLSQNVSSCSSGNMRLLDRGGRDTTELHLKPTGCSSPISHFSSFKFSYWFVAVFQDNTGESFPLMVRDCADALFRGKAQDLVARRDFPRVPHAKQENIERLHTDIKALMNANTLHEISFVRCNLKPFNKNQETSYFHLVDCYIVDILNF